MLFFDVPKRQRSEAFVTVTCAVSELTAHDFGECTGAFVIRCPYYQNREYMRTPVGVDTLDVSKHLL